MIRVLNAIGLVVAIALAVALYIAKTEAKNEQERLAELQAELAEERRQINVLGVEIAHLEDPERLRTLARRYLGFEPLDPSRELELHELPLVAEPQEPSVDPSMRLATMQDEASPPERRAALEVRE